MKTRISSFGAAAFAAMLGVLEAPAFAALPEPPAAEGAARVKATDYIPRVSLRDLPLFDRVLVLDEGQRAILEALILDVEGVGATRESLAAFRDNLTAVLNETQASRLEEAWRVIFRERMEAVGAVAGERVDIGALALSQMRGEPSEAIDRAFNSYRAELGPLLDAREAAAAVVVEGAPPSKELHQIRLNIRNVNDNAIAAFASALPPALADGFRREARAKSYPTAHTPSYPLEMVRKLAGEFPEDSLRNLVAEADGRFAALCDRAVTAIRLRDDARVADEDARARADQAIQESEKGYESLDTWVCASVQKLLTEQQLNASETGRDLLAFVRSLEGGALMAWDDKAAVTARFDGDGNGEIDDNEGARALNAFVRSVGRNQRRRL